VQKRFVCEQNMNDEACNAMSDEAAADLSQEFLFAVAMKYQNTNRKDWPLHLIQDAMTSMAREILHLRNINASLRKEIRTQRHEIAQHVNVRNTLLGMNKPPVKDSL
jgi:hypothetical protein